MKNCTLIDNINWIDWNNVIDQLHNGVRITSNFDNWDLNTPGYLEIYKLWNDANFNLASAEWINYYPETHYSATIVDKISNWLNVKPIRSWISQVNPGYYAPWHWDVDDNEQEYLKGGDIQRFSCFISNTCHGHIFMLGDDYIFNQQRGNLYKWNNYKEWHSGINAGMRPKYMFHLLTYR